LTSAGNAPAQHNRKVGSCFFSKFPDIWALPEIRSYDRSGVNIVIKNNSKAFADIAAVT
jgi:hypothetical protein